MKRKNTGSLVSVVVVNWNGKKWLKKCLDSLYAQTYKNFEIILVDNASIDDSVEFVEKYYPDVVIVQSKKNCGFAGGNNLGVSKSKGDKLLFLNNDTWVKEDFLEKLLRFYELTGYDVVGPLEADYFSGEERLPYVSTIDPFGWHIYLPVTDNQTESFYLTGVCVLVSKSLYLESGGFDNDFFMYCEEVDWFWRLQLLDRKCFYAQDIFVYHAGSGSSKKGLNRNTFLWRNQNTLQMLLKNYAWYNLFWVLPVYLIQNVGEAVCFMLILKPRIAYSYLEGWLFNIRNLVPILKERKIVQKMRKAGDLEILRKMYFGFGKMHHAIQLLRRKKL